MDYSDELVVLFESTEHAPHAVDEFIRTISPFGMCLNYSTYEVLPQDWELVAPSLILSGEELTVVDRCINHGKSAARGGDTVI